MSFVIVVVINVNFIISFLLSIFIKVLVTFRNPVFNTSESF